MNRKASEAKIVTDDENLVEYRDIPQSLLVRFDYDDGAIRCKVCQTRWVIHDCETLLLLALAARAHYRTCFGDFKP